MKRWLLLGAVVLFSTTGCGDGPFAMVSAAERDALTKLDTGTHELVAKEELSRLRGVGRFQVIPLGLRAWRLDTATGQTCLLFASDEDWKNEKLKSQSC